MKKDILLSQPAFVEIQGHDALTLLEITDTCSIYRVANFQSPQVIINDYRTKINDVLKLCLQNGDVSRFAYFLCQPAQVVFSRQGGNLVFELYETTVQTPNKMIWIVAGLPEDQFFNYQYDFSLVQRSDGSQLVSAIAIYSLTEEESSSFSASLANEMANCSL